MPSRNQLTATVSVSKSQSNPPATDRSVLTKVCETLSETCDAIASSTPLSRGEVYQRLRALAWEIVEHLDEEEVNGGR